jgi:hypothetical protein
MNALWLRLTLIMACLLVAAIASAAVLVFLGAIGYMALRETTSPAFAALMIVLGGVTVIAVAMTSAYILLGRNHRAGSSARSAARGEQDRLIADVAELLGGELAQIIRAKPYAAAAASLAAGFAVGALPELRSLLSSVLLKR